MAAEQSFAAFALARLPALRRRLSRRDAACWLAEQDSLQVDGQQRWLIGGDRLFDKAEMLLDWARGKGLVDAVALAALQDEYGRTNPDTEAVEIDPLPGSR